MPETELATRPLTPRGVFEDAPASVVDLTDRLGLALPTERAAILSKAEASTKRIAESHEQVARESERGLTEANTALAKAAETAPPRTPLAIPAPPSAASRAFLEPPESVLGQVRGVLVGIGQMAMQAHGLRGSAIGAVSALKGLAEGWAAGDAERVKREYAQWHATSDKLIADHRAEREAYLDAFNDRRLTYQEALEAVRMRADMAGHRALGEAAKLGHYQTILNLLHQDQQHEERLQQFRTASDRWHTTATETERFHRAFIKRADEDRAERAREADQRHADALAAASKRSGKRASGEFYDAQQGRIRSISEGEEQDDLERAKRGEAPRFRHLSEGRQGQLDRLIIAPPVLDRLDQLVDRITAAAPGQNVTTGLIQKLSRVSGIGEDVTELHNLNADLAVELTSALSGGAGRISILRLIRGEAQPSEMMTTDVAKTQIRTARTTIKNRATGLTGDPDALEKLSSRLSPYMDRPNRAPPEELPDPKSKKGKRLKDTQTGKVYESNGVTWTEISGAQ